MNSKIVFLNKEVVIQVSPETEIEEQLWEHLKTEIDGRGSRLLCVVKENILTVRKNNDSI